MARGALTSWWSSLATPEETVAPPEAGLDAAAESAESAQPAVGQSVSPSSAAGVAETRPTRPRFESAAGDGQPVSATACP